MSELEIYRGDSKTYTLTFTDGDGAAIDITGWTIFFTAKRLESDADADAVITKDVTSHTSPTEGLSAITLSATDTNVNPKKYYYDIQVKKDDGSIITLTKDKLEILTDITRRTS